MEDMFLLIAHVGIYKPLYTHTPLITASTTFFLENQRACPCCMLACLLDVVTYIGCMDTAYVGESPYA